MSPPRVVIAGAGPAGMVLAYQLASHGVPVHVVERHPDFRREFRGELVHTSALAPLEKIGVLPLLKARGLATDNVERRMFVGLERRVSVPGSNVRGNVISQAGFLELLHELCSVYPHYRIDFSASAFDLERTGERVTGIKVREGAEERVVHGDVVVVCSGRNSVLRKAAGLVPESFHVGENTMWLRFDFSDAPERLPGTVDIHMWGEGIVVVLFRSLGDRLQVAVQAPGDINALRKDIPALKALLLPRLPESLRDAVAAKLDDHTESQMFKVAVDRLPVWHAPGILFLGDAAHTMSPSGAVGLNLAMIDAFCAADAFLGALEEGRAIDASVFQAIQDARLPPIVTAQDVQLRAHGMVNKPRLALHVILTILQLFLPMIEKKAAAAETRLAPFQIRYAKPPTLVPT